MGRTYNSEEVAFSGWFYTGSIPSNSLSLVRIGNSANGANWRCIAPVMKYETDGKYKYCHESNDGSTYVYN